MTERWIGTRTTIHHLEQAAAEQRRREQDWNESVFSVRLRTLTVCSRSYDYGLGRHMVKNVGISDEAVAFLGEFFWCAALLSKYGKSESV
jgi:hypothetical protein